MVDDVFLDHGRQFLPPYDALTPVFQNLFAVVDGWHTLSPRFCFALFLFWGFQNAGAGHLQVKEAEPLTVFPLLCPASRVAVTVIGVGLVPVQVAPPKF